MVVYKLSEIRKRWVWSPDRPRSRACPSGWPRQSQDRQQGGGGATSSRQRSSRDHPRGGAAMTKAGVRRDEACLFACRNGRRSTLPPVRINSSHSPRACDSRGRHFAHDPAGTDVRFRRPYGRNTHERHERKTGAAGLQKRGLPRTLDKMPPGRRMNVWPPGPA